MDKPTKHYDPESIVSRLPKTADGVPVIPGIDTVFGYAIDQSGIVEMSIEPGVDSGMWATFDGVDRYYVASCFSSKEEAAKAIVERSDANGVKTLNVIYPPGVEHKVEGP